MGAGSLAPAACLTVARWAPGARKVPLAEAGRHWKFKSLDCTEVAEAGDMGRDPQHRPHVEIAL